jgi:hypothetical protein
VRPRRAVYETRSRPSVACFGRGRAVDSRTATGARSDSLALTARRSGIALGLVPSSARRRARPAPVTGQPPLFGELGRRLVCDQRRGQLSSPRLR